MPAGVITDANQPPIRAVGALNGADVQLHYTRQGPKNLDGSWRMIRAQYAADTPAGVPGVRGYSAGWAETENLIEFGGAGPLPSDTPHSAVNLANLRFEFETQMQGIAHEDAVTPFEFGAAGPVRTWRVDPLNSTHYELRDPWTQVTTPREELPDTAGAGGRYMRAYMVHARMLPEGVDGAGGGPQDVDEPSLTATLIYEVASGDLDGWGRATRFWVQLGHSFAAAIADVRAPDFPMARFVSPPKLRIYSADPVNDPVDVVIYGNKAFLPEPVTAVSGGVEFDLTKWDPNFGTPSASQDLKGYDTYHDGISRVYQGVVYWRGGDPLTASESSTRSAILHGLEFDAPGHDCVQYAVSDNLKDYRTYGAFGIVPDPAEDGWAIETLRDQTATQARSFYDFYVVDDARDPWQDCHLGTPAYTNQGAAQRGFGAITFMPWAMSGHPDVRALWLCASQEAQRWHHFRKLDGSHWRWDELRVAGTPSTYDSSCVFGDGRPWFSFNFNTRYPDLSAHEPWSLMVGRWGDIKRSRKDVGDFDISTARGRDADGWKGYDFQHFTQNSWVAFTHLTGDRWCLDSELIDQINLVICSRQTFPDPNRGTFAWSTEGVGVPRAEGRWLRALAHVGNLVTRSEDEDVFFKRYAERTAWLRYIGTNTTPNAPTVFGDWANDLNGELAEISRDNGGYFQQGGSNRYQICATGQPAWTTNPDGWSSWHIGILCQALYGVYLMASRDPDSVQRAQAQADIGLMLQKMTKSGVEKGFELTELGDWRGFYAVPADDPGMVRGRAPLESEWGANSPGYTGLCDENGVPRTDPHFGPAIPGAGGIASFRRGGTNLGTKWTVGIPLLADIFNPGDQVVADRQTDLLVTNPIFPSQAVRRSSLFSDLEPWAEFWSIIEDPFTWPKTISGPQQYEENFTATVTVDTEFDEVGVIDEEFTSAVVVDTEFTEEAFAALIDEQFTSTVAVSTEFAETVFDAPVVDEQFTATVDVVTVFEGGLAVDEEFTASVVVDVEMIESVVPAATPDGPEGPEGQTLREALGTGNRRSRHARIIRTGNNVKRLSPGRETGRGPGPRIDDEDPFRRNGR